MAESKIQHDFLTAAGPKGYYCKYGDFYLDPLQVVGVALVSHGHGDHATPGHGVTYCTGPTRSFIEARANRSQLGKFSCVSYHQELKFGGVRVRFIPAGHILGSAQILMEFEGVKYLYTGDYKLQADATCEAFEVCQADVLITETTFANPLVQHPDPILEIQKLNTISHPIMLGTYALGKAQRLTHLIHTHCPEKRVLLHHSIMPLHRIYEYYGVALGSYELYNRKAMKLSSGPSVAQNVYMVPPMTYRSYQRAKNVVRLFASGWKHLQANEQNTLFISDHVDWADLLQTIVWVQPREIWTMHGDGRELSSYFAGRLPVRSV